MAAPSPLPLALLIDRRLTLSMSPPNGAHRPLLISQVTLIRGTPWLFLQVG